MIEPGEVARIVKSLTKAQREWIAAMPTIPVSLSEEQWEEVPELWVQFTPDEYCPETGCYLGGGEMHWFGSAIAHKPVGPDWYYSAQLNETGLAVRSALAKENDRGE